MALRSVRKGQQRSRRQRYPAHQAPVPGSALSWRQVAVFVVMWAVLTAVTMAKSSYMFYARIYENGDAAANSLLISQAVHLHLLVGNYSRLGFNHPGPDLLYIEAIGQQLMFSLAHLVPSRFGGQLAAVVVSNTAMLAASAAIAYRHWRNYLLSALVVVVPVATDVHAMWVSTWMPYVYVAPFLLAAVAGASVASGALRDLPAFVTAVVLLINGHVSFVAIAGAYVLVVVVAWDITRGRYGLGYRQAAATGRRSLLVAAVITAVLITPMALELALHWPGPWGKYLAYVGQEHGNKVVPAIGYVAQYWPQAALSVAFLALGAAGLGLTVPMGRTNRVVTNGTVTTGQDLGNPGGFAWGLAMTVLFMTLAVFYYGWRDVDGLTKLNGYTGDFYAIIPGLLPLVAVGPVLSLARSHKIRKAQPATRWSGAPSAVGRAPWQATVAGSHQGYGQKTARTPRAILAARSVVPVAAMVAPALLPLSPYYGSTSTAVINGPWASWDYRGEPDIAPMTAALANAPARGARAVVVVGAPETPHALWPQVAGVLLQAHRTGLALCSSDSTLAFLYSPPNICSRAVAMSGYKVAIEPASTTAVAGWRRIWGDSAYALWAQSRELTK